MDNTTNELDTEQEWQWCLVGNIVEKHKYGEEHIIKYGNKQFRPNAKVYVNLIYFGMGHETILVIGTPRHSSKYIEISIARKYVCNFRVKKVFKPAVLKKMKESKWDWWGNSDEAYDNIVRYIDYFNKDAEQYKVWFAAAANMG